MPLCSSQTGKKCQQENIEPDNRLWQCWFSEVSVTLRRIAPESGKSNQAVTLPGGEGPTDCRMMHSNSLIRIPAGPKTNRGDPDVKRGHEKLLCYVVQRWIIAAVYKTIVRMGFISSTWSLLHQQYRLLAQLGGIIIPKIMHSAYEHVFFFCERESWKIISTAV